MINYKQIPYLEDCESLQTAINTAKQCLSLYSEYETTFYNDLHCGNKEIIKTCKKHIKQLNKFIKESEVI